MRRVRAGRYESRDGRFLVLLDPTSGDLPQGWGFRSWLIFDRDGVEPDDALFDPYSDRVHQPTLRDCQNIVDRIRLAKSDPNVDARMKIEKSDPPSA